MYELIRSNNFTTDLLFGIILQIKLSTVNNTSVWLHVYVRMCLMFQVTDSNSISTRSVGVCRTTFPPEKSYIITGGMGGLGEEKIEALNKSVL